MLTSVKFVFIIAIPRSLVVILNLPSLIGVRSSDICTSTMSPTRIAHSEIGLNLLFGLSSLRLACKLLICRGLLLTLRNLQVSHGTPRHYLRRGRDWGQLMQRAVRLDRHFVLVGQTKHEDHRAYM